MIDYQKIIIKVKRLLRLANSSQNINEAYIAYDLADRMIIEYGLDPEPFDNYAFLVED